MAVRHSQNSNFQVEAVYTNWDGQKVTRRLDGFAANVFQHEYDHLQGKTTIDHPGADVKKFNTEKEMLEFLAEVKKEDAERYTKGI